eukprot:scaffold8969_cov145-Skeletonema_menzelii.AAC.2
MNSSGTRLLLKGWRRIPSRYAEQCTAEDFIFYRLFLVSSFVGSDKTLLDWEKCMQNKVKLLDIGQKTEKNLGSVRRSSFLAGASE